MSVLLYGILLFFLAFISHFFIWEIHLPKNHTGVLLGIYSGVLVIGIFLLRLYGRGIVIFGIHTLSGTAEYVHLCLLYASLTFAYITTYSGIEVDSPSLVIVMDISLAGSDGLPKEKLEQTMNDDLLVKPRVKDLVSGGMAYVEKDKYRLTAKGLFLISIFNFYRRLLHLGKGG